MSYTKRMNYQLKPRKPIWRKYLLFAEAARVDEIERACKRTAAMKVELITIRNRASQRALRDAAKRSA